jgi:HlyD family secretion protein
MTGEAIRHGKEDDLMRQLLPRLQGRPAARTIAVCAAMAAVAIAVLAGHRGDAGETAAAPGPAPRGVAALGRIEPAGGVIRVGAPSIPDAVSGAVLTVLKVDRGQDVAAGELLAELDTAAISEARVAESAAALEIARRSARAAASLAEEACVRAEVAARQSSRKADLLSRGLAAREDADLAQGEAEAGAASCAARRSEAQVAESHIAAAQASLVRHRAELARSFVRAPVAGRVLDLHARPGELVGADGILELGRIDEMYAIAEVYETDIRFVRAGQRARVTSDALAAPLEGTVERIRPKVNKLDEIGTDPAALKDARIVEVEVRLDDAAAAANLTHLQVQVEIGR